MPGKSSPVYWHDRKVQYDASLAKDEKRLYSKLAAYYEKEAARLDKEIAAYYTKYSVNGVLSYRNLLETLPDADKRLLIEQLDEFVKKYPDYADLVPVRESIYKLNRLEGLRQSIAMQQLHMGAYEQQQALSFFQRQALRYANGAASFLGLGSGFYRLDSDVIRASVGNKWCDGKDFSERIWNNRTKLGNALHTQFVNGVIRGDDYHQLARQLREKFTQVSQKNAERLTFTEDTYLSNEAAMQVFEREASVTEYEYICTGDAETCDICRGLSGERFKIAERVPGLNFPPMHPWCRCFFDPVIPEKKTLTSGTDSGIITSNGIQTTSLSWHMKERSEERGVSLDDVKDALTNPLHIDEIKYDGQGRPSQRFIGEGATVNVNPETGIITTVWKTGSGKIKKYKKR
jgi:SPP1 gp7 family putative phage head morphogenesis protein